VEGAGWEYVHVPIDDAARVAYSQVLPDEQGDSTSMFLRAAVAYYAGLGVVIREILTDSGSCYRSLAFRATVQALGLKHRSIHQEPTARPSGSSNRRCGSGPTPEPIDDQTSLYGFS